MKRKPIPKRIQPKKENWFDRGPQFDHVDDFVFKLNAWLAWGLWRLYRLTLVMCILAFVLTVISNQVTPKKAKPPAIQTNTIQSR